MQRILFIFILLLLTSCGSKKSESPDMVIGSVYDSTSITEIVGNQTEKMVVSNVTKPQQPDGTFIYQIDTIFTIEQTSRVEVRIIKRLYDNIPEDVVELFYKSSNGKIKKEYIKTGNIMDVNLICLTPDAFTFNKITNDQPVDENTITEWIWGVTPKKIGKFNLILKVTIKSKGISKDKVVFDKIINVENQPKRYFSVLVDGDRLKNLSPRTITLTISETDKETSDFKWRGTGVINIEFKRPSNFTINKEGDNVMNDNKGLYITNWVVTPDTKLDSVEVKIKVIGDNEQVIIYDKYITIDEDFKKIISNFINKTKDGWYWLFTTLLIPLYHYIKKKYFPNKTIFRRKRKVNT